MNEIIVEEEIKKFWISKMQTNKFSFLMFGWRLKLEELRGHKFTPVTLRKFSLFPLSKRRDESD